MPKPQSQQHHSSFFCYIWLDRSMDWPRDSRSLSSLCSSPLFPTNISENAVLKRGNGLKLHLNVDYQITKYIYNDWNFRIKSFIRIRTYVLKLCSMRDSTAGFHVVICHVLRGSHIARTWRQPLVAVDNT